MPITESELHFSIGLKMDVRDNNCQVVRLEPQDTDLAAKCGILLRRSLGQYIGPDLLLRILPRTDACIVCARAGQGVIGVAGGWVLGEDGLAGPDNLPDTAETTAGYVKALAVSDDWRRRSVGALLLKNLLHYFASCGCSKAIAEGWDGSVAFFRRQGFEVKCKVPNRWYEESLGHPGYCVECGTPCTCSAILLIKDLDAAAFPANSV